MALVEGLRGFVPFSQISSVSSCLRTVDKHFLLAGNLVSFKKNQKLINDWFF